MFNGINAILGVALLAAGRKVFWLFVGAAGFVTGIELTMRLFRGAEGMAIIIGLVIGLIFALLAIFLQTIAIGIAGFLSGGYILLALTTMLGLDRLPILLIYLVGGIIGVILISFLFDWAIITLSSLAGASLVIGAFRSGRGVAGLIFFALFLGGVIFQGLMFRNEQQQKRT